MGAPKKEMDPKHLKAIFFYMRGMSKKDCLLKAGFSESVARTDAKSVFNRDDVQAEIKRRQDMAGKRAEVNEDWVIERLKAIADASLGECIVFDENGYPDIDFSKMSSELQYALGGLKVRKYNKGRGEEAVPVTEFQPQLVDKLRALEMLAKYLGMFTDKIELSADDDLIERLHAGRARAAKRNKGEADGEAEE